MSQTAQLRVISYDISDDRRRRRICSVLEDGAVRMQESLFEARLTDRQTNGLWTKLNACLGPGDSLRIYTIPDSALSRSHSTGGPDISQGARYWLL